MRIEFRQEGGFAHLLGLSKPIVVDTTQMPDQQARELERLVETACFFELPPQAWALPRGVADVRRYTVTIEHAGRRHTVQLTDLVDDPALQALLDQLRGMAHEQRARH
jgi:hypothetical protein